MSRRPYNHDRVINLHCGLGRDSIAMVVLAAEGRLQVDGLGGDVSLNDIDAVVFSDTGCEWMHTYAEVEPVRRFVEEHGGRFIVVAKGDGDRAAPVERMSDVASKAATGAYHCRPSVMDDFRSRATVASLGKGDCTDNHKIQPMRRLMSDQHHVRCGVKDNAARGRQVRAGECQPSLVLIGIAADETRRIANGGRSPSYVEERYPLVSMRIAKTDEQPILERGGFGRVRKSGCFMCPYQPASWYWALSKADPEQYARVVAYERIALKRNPRMGATGFTRKGKPLPIPEVVMRWRTANPRATVKAVLEKSYEHCPAAARAQRKRDQQNVAS